MITQILRIKPNYVRFVYLELNVWCSPRSFNLAVGNTAYTCTCTDREHLALLLLAEDINSTVAIF